MHAQAYWPQARGFDSFSGYLQGCGSQDTHVSSCCGAPANASDFDHFVCANSGGKDYRGGDWWRNGTDASSSANHTSSSDLIAGLAEEAIATWSQSGEPFFLYLPFQNIHAPYDATQESVDRFASLSASIQQKTMFAYLYELDVAVGRVVAALQAANILSDSLIAFVSDNGAPQAPGVDGRNYPFVRSRPPSLRATWTLTRRPHDPISAPKTGCVVSNRKRSRAAHASPPFGTRPDVSPQAASSTLSSPSPIFYRRLCRQTAARRPRASTASISGQRCSVARLRETRSS